jgi:DNA-binding NarL/FixJ family response regulator
MQILVTDDHPIVLEGIRMVLNSIVSQADIHVAGNGEEALGILEKHPVELVFLDIALPDINGVELCKEIRSRSGKIKIVGFSANQEIAIVSDFIKSGGNGFILKTADKADYTKCIQTKEQAPGTVDNAQGNPEFPQHHPKGKRNFAVTDGWQNRSSDSPDPVFESIHC